MKLEGLDWHLRLIESYKKLHRARGLACQRDYIMNPRQHRTVKQLNS